MVQATHQISAGRTGCVTVCNLQPCFVTSCKQEPHHAIIIAGSKEQPTATEQGTAYKAQHTEGTEP